MVEYTNDGETWYAVDDGKIFNGNSDRNTKVTNMFDSPVTAITLKIRPVT